MGTYKKNLIIIDIDTFLRKPVCWKYEKEVRMIKYLSESNYSKNNIHLFKIPPSAIKQLVLGANLSNENSDLLLNNLSKNNDLNHIKIYKASLHREKFALEFKQI